MRKIKTLVILLAIFSLLSCKNKSLKIDNENLKLEIEKAPNFHRDFTNKIQYKYLDIEADRINLKNLFSILLETDSTNISFNNKELNKQYFKVEIKQKNQDKPINKIALEQVLKEWNLNLVTKKNKTYRLELIDSIKLISYKTKSTDNLSKVIQTKDSVKIKNCDLNKLAEILNSKYSEEIAFDSFSKKVDYSFKKESFLKLKVKIENDLGINFVDLNKDKSTYIVENN